MTIGTVAPPETRGILVKTSVFEGELAELVQLIHRQAIPIWDLICSDVTAQIASQVAEVSLDQAGLALSLGAWLPSAKARALVKRYVPDEASAEDELCEADPPDLEGDAEARAAALALERELIEELAQLVDEHQIDTFRRPGRSDEGQGSDPEVAAPRELTVDDLIAELEAVDKTLLTGSRFTVEGLMLELRGRAQGGLVLQEFAGDDVELLVAAFLALLELVRRRQVRAQQVGAFGPVEIAAP